MLQRKDFSMVKLEPSEMKPNKAHIGQRLMDAIATGRLYQTKCLLEINDDVNFVNEEGNSPLHCAAMIEDEKHRTRKEMLKLLLKHNADVNLPDSNGRHILSWACFNNKEDIVHLLFRYSIQDLDLNMVDLDGNTALMYAVRSQNLNIVHKLVQSIVRFGLDIDLRNDQDCTAYLEARRLGFEECANILVEDGHASKDILVNPFLDGNEIETGENSRELKEEGNPRRKVSPRINRILVNPEMKRKHRVTPDITRTREPALKRSSTRPKSSGFPRKLLLKRYGSENEVILSYDSLPKALSSQKDGRESSLCTTKASSKSLDMTDKRIGLIINNDTQMNHTVNLTTRKNFLTPTSSTRGSTRNSALCHSHIQKRPTTVGVNQRCQKQLRLNNFGVFSSSNSYENNEIMTGRTLQRSRTMPGSTRSSCSDISAISDSSSEMSWYSHFSHDDNSQSFLSLSNMQSLMQLYAVQASDTTSFRVGLPMPKSLPPDPQIPAEEDKHSEGTKSEDTQHTALSSNTKRFAVVTRTVASYLQQKRNLTTIKVKDRIPGL